MSAKIEVGGPWVVYNDPRSIDSVSLVPWGQNIQRALLEGRLSWDCQGWSAEAIDARQHVIMILDQRLISVDVRDGVAHISNPAYDKLDDVSRHTCEIYKLYDAADLKKGVFSIGIGRYKYLVKSAVALPEREWFHGIPLAEVKLYPNRRSYAVVGRLDVRPVVTWRDTNNDLRMQALPAPIKGGTKRLIDLSKPRWRYSANVVSAQVAEHLPRWEAFLEREKRAAREKAAAREEAEREVIRRQIDEDADAGVFDGL